MIPPSLLNFLLRLSDLVGISPVMFQLLVPCWRTFPLGVLSGECFYAWGTMMLLRTMGTFTEL